MATTTEHMWGHFTRTIDAPPIVIERAEGCYIYDSRGNRYLDALSALYCVNIGYGPWPEIVEAAKRQLETLPFFHNWVGFATPPALELADKLAELLPIDVGRIFFVGGGSEATETAIKAARQYHRLRGEPTRYKLITRRSSYHGTSMGALSINGSAALRQNFEPLLPGCLRAPTPYQYRCAYCHGGPCDLTCADEVDRMIENEGPQTVAAVIMEPVQNSAGSITPPPGYFERIREICDVHGVLLVADEVICGFGRLGAWSGCERYGIEPDMITFAKGVTSAYAPLGGLAASEKVVEPFTSQATTAFTHGLTFGGHALSCAVGLANLAVMEREDLLGRVRRYEPEFRAKCQALADEHPMVGDLRGAGYFWSLELVKDKLTKETFTPAERDEVKSFVTVRARDLGVYLRVDDRGETCAQFAPPLVAGPEQFDEMIAALRQTLDEAWERYVA